MTSPRDDISHISERLGKEPGIGAIALLAENYQEQQNHALAAEVCRRGLDLYPGNLELRLILGEALMGLQQPEEAEEALLPLVVEVHRLGRVFQVLAKVYRQQERLREAEQAEEVWALLNGTGQGSGPPEPETAGEIDNDFWNLGAAGPSTPPPALEVQGVLEKWLRAVQTRKQTG